MKKLLNLYQEHETTSFHKKYIRQDHVVRKDVEYFCVGDMMGELFLIKSD